MEKKRRKKKRLKSVLTLNQVRARGARKDSTSHNFQDSFCHLWDRSRPVIVSMERCIKRHKPKVTISTEIEAAVQSLFLEEAG